MTYDKGPRAPGAVVPTSWGNQLVCWVAKGRCSTLATRPVPQQPQRPLVVVVSQAERNGLGTTSFILGLLGTLFVLLPLGVVLALPSSFIGLTLGVGNIGRLRRHRATNKIMTVLGVAFSILGITFSIIMIHNL